MVAWHPSGELLVSASYDDTVKLWVDSGDDWECVQTLSGSGVGHTSTVWGVAFSADGGRLVTCSDDLSLKFWSCQLGPGEWGLCTGCLAREGAGLGHTSSSCSACWLRAGSRNVARFAVPLLSVQHTGQPRSFVMSSPSRSWHSQTGMGVPTSKLRYSPSPGLADASL